MGRTQSNPATQRRSDVAPVVTQKRVSVAARDAQVRTIHKQGGGEQLEVTVPISSTSMDRDGDNFSVEGLASMAAKLNTGTVPLFLDHGADDFGWPMYRVLDIVGGWTEAEVQGEVLMATAVLDPEDPNAQALASKLKAGLPIGFSVGFMPQKTEAIRDDGGEETGGLVFHAVDLFETSAVGIPSNPDGVHMARGLAQYAENRGLDKSQVLLQMKSAFQLQGDDSMADDKKNRKEADPNAEPDGKGVGEGEESPVTLGAVKDLIKENNEELRSNVKADLKEALQALSKQDDEDDDEEEEDSKDTDKGKAAKAPKARGIQSGVKSKADDEDDDEDKEDDEEDEDEKSFDPEAPYGKHVGPFAGKKAPVTA